MSKRKIPVKKSVDGKNAHTRSIDVPASEAMRGAPPAVEPSHERNTNEQELDRLAGHPDVTVRLDVARHANTSAEVRTALASDPDGDVRRAAIGGELLDEDGPDAAMPLYSVYRGQSDNASAYLNISNGRAYFDVAEYGDAVPTEVWQGVTQRAKIDPTLSAADYNNLLAELAPDIRAVQAALDTKWDGSNLRGHLAEKGDVALGRIVDLTGPTEASYERIGLAVYQQVSDEVSSGNWDEDVDFEELEADGEDWATYRVTVNGEAEEISFGVRDWGNARDMLEDVVRRLRH